MSNSPPPPADRIRSRPELARDYVAPDDVLFRDPSLAHGLDTMVLGLPVSFRTNSKRVFDMVDDAFGPYSIAANAAGSGAQSRFLNASPSPVGLHVQIVVYDGSSDDGGGTTVRHICPDPHRVLVHGAGGMAIVDPLRREALIYASNDLVCEEETFRHGFLEAATLALVTHFDRQPFHAAAINHEGKALLLTGPSGAGKSTLAYLARTAGYTVLSEDMVWVQLESGLKVWSRPRTIHLLAGAERHFPELEHEEVALQPNGKYKMKLRLKQELDSSAPVTDVAVCLLQPGCAVAAVTAVTSDDLLRTLLRDADAGFDRYPERRLACIRALSANGGWRLALSDNAHDALPLLSELLRGSS